MNINTNLEINHIINILIINMLIITILIYKIHLTTICVFILGRSVLMKDGGGKSSERSSYFILGSREHGFTV